MATWNNTVYCNSGAELVAAIADPSCRTAVLVSGVTLKEQDWSGYSLPVALGRDLIIAGSLPNGTLDLNFAKAKVAMANGTTLTLRHLVLENFRSGSSNQAPGFDLLLPMPPGASATIWMEDMSYTIRVCFPLAVGQEAAKAIQRPPQIPGSQVYALPAPLPELFPQQGCVNGTSISPFHRCYVYSGRYIDVATAGADALPNGRTQPNGYVLRLYNVYAVCASVMSDDCIARLGPIGYSL